MFRQNPMFRQNVVRAHRRIAVAGSVLAAVAVGTSACATSSGGSSSGTSGGSTSGTIALLLPESQTARYESADRPIFTAALKKLCPSCKLDYYNAGQDSATQQNQGDQALTNGAKVMVLDPVDSTAAAAIARKAEAQGVKVVAYDRPVQDTKVDALVTFDNEKVGTLQGDALVQKLGSKAKDGETVVINGSKTDNNAILFNKGAEAALKGKVNIGYDVFTQDWLPANAGTEMDQAITKIGKNNIAGVYSANDTMAGAIIASLKRAGVSPLPPVTGQDAELAAVQRILAGEQFMSIYKSYKQEATAAAGIAYALLQGKSITGLTNQQVANGAGNVPAQILAPVVLTVANVEQTVVKDGLYSVSQICTTQYAADCTKAGVS